MKNSDHDPRIGKTNVTPESECKESKTKQPDRGVQPNESNIYMSNYHKNNQTPLPAASLTTRRKGPVATSTKQMAGYFTVSGIENELSISENMWPCFALKELSDNAYDWLNDYYPNNNSVDSRTKRRYIAIRIQIDKIPNDTDLT